MDNEDHTKARFAALIKRRKQEMELSGHTFTAVYEETTKINKPNEWPTPHEIAEDGVPCYYFDSKYVTGDTLTIFQTYTDKNQLIEKITTGVGGTRSQMDQDLYSVIIVSPNVSQVENKEEGKQEYRADNIFFFYGGCKDKWSDVEKCIDEGRQVVINTTPDNLLEVVRKSFPSLYEKLKSINLFIDESHQMVLDADYRAVMEVLYMEINTKWKATYKLSTATTCPLYIDIPEGVEIIRIGKKGLQPTYGFISDHKDAYKFYLQDQITLDRLTIIYTNSKDVFEYVGYKYHNIAHYGASEALETKGRKYFRNYEEEVLLSKIIEEDKHRVIVLSSSWFAGVDILPKRPCSVIFINEPNKEHCNFNLLQLKQAFGRPRFGIVEFLIVNRPLTGWISKGDYNVPYNPPTTKIELTDGLKKYFDKNSFGDRCEKIKLYNEFNMFNKDALLSELTKYKLEVEPYNIEGKMRSIGSMPFQDTYKNILPLCEFKLLHIVSHRIRYKLYGKGSGSFSSSDALFYYTAYIIKKYDHTGTFTAMLDDTTMETYDFHSRVLSALLPHCRTEMFNFENFFVDEKISLLSLESNFNYDKATMMELLIRGFDDAPPQECEVMDYLMLFWATFSKPDFYSIEYNRELDMEEVLHEKEKLFEYYNKPRNKEVAKRWMIAELCKRGLFDKDKPLPKDIEDLINVRIEDTFYEFKKNAEKHKEELKKNKNAKLKKVTNNKKIKNMMEFIQKTCLTIFSNGEGPLKSETRNREYTPLVGLPSFLRKYIPIKLDTIDIMEAYPTFVKQMLLKDYKLIVPEMSVYRNVADDYKLDWATQSGRAKVLYNMFLNYETCDYDKTYKFFRQSVKYPLAVAKKVAEFAVTSQHGGVYDRFSLMEKQAIEAFISVNLDGGILKTCAIRFHDSVVIPTYLLMNVVNNGDNGYPFEIKFPLKLNINGVKYAHKSFNYGKKTYDFGR